MAVHIGALGWSKDHREGILCAVESYFAVITPAAVSTRTELLHTNRHNLTVGRAEGVHDFNSSLLNCYPYPGKLSLARPVKYLARHHPVTSEVNGRGFTIGQFLPSSK